MFLLISILICCSGCIRRQETDKIAYILAIGIDKEGQDLKTTYQIAISRKLAGGAEGSGGGGTEETYILTTIKANNLADSRNILKSTLPRLPTAVHLKTIIVGEELAREGLGSLVSPLMRFREYRGNIFLLVVRGSAQDFMNANKTKLENLPSKYYETMFYTAKEGGSTYLLTDLHDFYTRLRSHIGSPYLVYAGINSMDEINNPSKPRVKPEKAEEYRPEGIPRSGNGSPTEFVGIALFKADKMVGSLTSEETQMMAILQGDFSQSFFVVEDPLELKQSVNVRIQLGEKPKINCILNDGQVTYNISVCLEAEISSIPSGVNYENDEYKNLLEKQVSQAIDYQIRSMLTHTQNLGTDPVGLIAYIRPNFKTYDEMVVANLTDLYSQAEINLDVKTVIRRTGLMWRTSEINRR